MNKERRVPPRVYCDICEEFDLHETEDCPQQTNDDVAVQNVNADGGGDRKRVVPERPYCDICESMLKTKKLIIIHSFIFCYCSFWTCYRGV